MHYLVEIAEKVKKLPPVKPFHVNGKGDPLHLYLHPNFEESLNPNVVYVTVSGANQKAKTKTPNLLFRPYDMHAHGIYRCLSVLVSLPQFDSDSQTQAKQHPSLKLNQPLKCTPELMRKLWPRAPYTFMAMLIAVDEQYAKEKNIIHRPWIRDYVVRKNITAECTTWEKFFDLCPEMFQ